ncbi:unnamed protein product [Oreochromis niloticus]|nr:unnamed protein product [Mustela putorius furo]
MWTQQTNFFLLATVSYVSAAADGQIRLAGSGSTRCSGRVEIYHRGSWGTVCDDAWDLKDAAVVCRQLNCGTALSATTDAHFGEGTGPIWLRRVDCSGHERSLSECDLNRSQPSCGHSKDAGVLCSESLQRPSISLRYDGGSVQGPKSAEITGGSSFEFTCSITSRYTPGRFMLIFSGSNQKRTKPAVRNSARFSFPAAEYEHWGRYSCVYEINVSMKEFQSSESPPIHVIITFPLQQPSISLTSPNGGLVWGPEGAEITKGSSFVFSCSINSRYTPGCFRLFFSGVNLTEPAVNHSASFSFPAAEYEHQGSYSCVYELLLPSRTFTSAESAPIRLIITLAATNGYEDDDEEEEEERDYVNVEPVKIKRKCGEQAGVADEESDNHDYVNIDDEIESTDDENDYVNVTDGC